MKKVRYWALQYGLHVEILKPLSLRNRVKEDIKKMAEKYGVYDRSQK